MRGVQAVTFDVGGTLIEPWPSVGHVYAGVAREFGLTGPEPDALTNSFVQGWKERREFNYSRDAWREVVDAAFTGAGADAPGEACFRAIYERFARASAWRMFENVMPALAALKARGIKTGVVSNWDERLRPLLEELGLSRHFDAIVVSHEAGCTKPAAEIFLLAAQRLGVPPASILHVGDSEREDVLGARRAGLQALRIVRSPAGQLRSPGGQVAATATSSHDTVASSEPGHGGLLHRLDALPDALEAFSRGGESD